MKRKQLRLIALMLTLSLLTGCGSLSLLSGRNAEGPAPAVLAVAVEETVDSLVPVRVKNGAERLVFTQLSRGLFAMQGGKVQYALCEDYTVTDDGLHYTFTLREDAKWSDGSSVTAVDFVRGITRAVQPDSDALHLDDALDYLAGAKEVHSGQSSAVLGVRAIEPRKLELTLRQPCADFPQLLSAPLFHPVASGSEEGEPLVSCGAFQLGAQNNGQLTLEKNPYFYDAPRVRLDRMIVYLGQSAKQQEEGFGSGRWQVATALPQDAATRYKNNNTLRFVQTLDTAALTLEDAGVLRDERVRQALALAVNRQALTSVLTDGEKPLYALVPTGIGNPATGLDFREEGGSLVYEDGTKAALLLKEAGFAEGKNFPALTLRYEDTPQMGSVAQHLQSQWKEALGIRVEISPLSQEWKGEGPVLTLRHTSLDQGDPLLYLEPYSSRGDHTTGFASQDYDDLLTEGKQEPDLGRQLEKYHQAERLLCESGWVLPLYRQGKVILASEKLSGFSGQWDGTLDFTYTVLPAEQ